MTAPRPLPETWAPGALIPGTVYRIIRPIGQGGMGEVYEVEHDMLGARRALKVLVKHYARREDLAERLRVEARGLARLKHPNLVEVYDLGTASDGRLFFAMEMLDGVTLRAMLRDRGRLSVRTSVELVVQVLAGLHAAHQAGILHRDVKPENVFVCRDGTVKLLDFGVAKAIDAWMPEQKITGAGMTVGTPKYMSPEQAEGANVDARTDLYAVGQMLWEMLAGRPAFDETEPYDLAQAKRTRGIAPLQEVPGIEATPALCEVVDRGCQADPDKRHSSADAFIRVLRSVVGTPTPAPAPVTPSLPAGGTQAYLAGAGREPSAGSEATGLDRGLGTGFAGTVPVPGGVVRELTERVEAIRPVNREARTEARASTRPRGPGGTEVLPAVAAKPDPDVPAASAPPVSDAAPSTKPAKRPPPPRALGPWGIAWASWFAGIAAFVVPVIIAAALAFWQFGMPASAPAASATEPPVSASVATASNTTPAASVLFSPPLPASSVPAATEGSAKPKPSSPGTTAPLPSTTAPARTRTPRPPRVPPPAPTPTATKKMPSSGL